LNNVTFCRPDETHWCVECCGHGTYSCLENGSDGKRGCVADYFGWTKPPECQKQSCIPKLWPNNSLTPEVEKIVRKAIFVLPPGEFKMSEVYVALYELKELVLYKVRFLPVKT